MFIHNTNVKLTSKKTTVINQFYNTTYIHFISSQLRLPLDYKYSPISYYTVVGPNKGHLTYGFSEFKNIKRSKMKNKKRAQ